jgi:hypothetical protein
MKALTVSSRASKPLGLGLSFSSNLPYKLASGPFSHFSLLKSARTPFNSRCSAGLETKFSARSEETFVETRF